MPNWCFNEVTVEGDETQLNEFGYVAGLLEKDGTEKENPELNFSEVYPCDDDETIKIEAAFQKTNKKEHAISSELFDWNRSHWGTKWSPGGEVYIEDKGKTFIKLRFDTAWSPPEGVYEHIILRWPKLVVHSKYEEPGNDLSGRETYYGDEAA